MRKLRVDASRLDVEAHANGWLKELPAGKLPDWLSSYMVDSLRQQSSGSACGSGWLNGVADLEQPLVCNEARRELQIVESGYAVDPKLTPLASTIVLNRLKSDLGS